MSKLNPKEEELWNAIRIILWEKWDPIGVYEEDSEWDDEYDSYVPHLFRLAIEGSDYTKIAASLKSTIKQSIGLSCENNSQHNIDIARLIVAAKQELLG